ncbi:hypothetical protein DFJ77DRAFT_462494, partial [Powellomyces hirtus]
MITILVVYLGMVAVVLLPRKADGKDIGRLVLPLVHTWLDAQRFQISTVQPVEHKGVILIAALDVFGNLVLTVGQFMVGSGLYQVIYASIVGITAVLSWGFLRRAFNPGQWAAVVVIMLGLSVSAVGSAQLPESASDHNVMVGFGITFLGTCIYSSVYTLNDYMLSSTKRPMLPSQQCFWVGLYSSCICLVVMIIVALPTLRTMPLSDPGVILMYLSLIGSSLGHNVTYFQLLESTGAVATGVLQALRAVMVFGLSHILFCKGDAAQCFTMGKGFATAIVCAGVVGFSCAKANKASHGFQRVRNPIQEEVEL